MSIANVASALKITEIFLSVQGESTRVGMPTVFVRLTGCPLRCHYCDTGYAFTGGRTMSENEIIAAVRNYGVSCVTVTGGEPLAQPGCKALLTALCDQGFSVSLETSGAMDIQSVDRRVMTVMDIKTPGSGEADRNRYQNIEFLRPTDQVKFVITDRADYDWAKDQATASGLYERCVVLYAPEHDGMNAALLADWILADRLPARLQIQLHKYLWGDARGR